MRINSFNKDDCINNAFRISLMVVEDEYECRCQDFLNIAFEEFSNKQYCYVTVTHSKTEYELVQKFEYVKPTIYQTHRDALFVLPRLVIMGEKIVRKITKDDSENIDNFFSMFAIDEDLIKSVEKCKGK